MTKHTRRLAPLTIAASLATGLLAGSAAAVDVTRLDITKENPGDWLTYHGTYRSYHHSALDEINAGNVKNLKVAWMHQPGRSTRGRRPTAPSWRAPRSPGWAATTRSRPICSSSSPARPRPRAATPRTCVWRRRRWRTRSAR